MTILSLTIGDDRVLMVQDSGAFDPTPPHRQVGVCAKILTLPHLRMIAGGAGSSGMLREWHRWLSFGLYGDTLPAIAECAPGWLRSGVVSPRDEPRSTANIIVVAALDATGRAAAILMQGARDYEPEWLRPGDHLLVPPTRDPVDAEALPDAPQQPLGVPPTPTPSEPPAEEPMAVDWTAQRMWFRRDLRLQLAQARTQFAPPFVSALLHPDGIDLREFVP